VSKRSGRSGWQSWIEQGINRAESGPTPARAGIAESGRGDVILLIG